MSRPPNEIAWQQSGNREKEKHFFTEGVGVNLWNSLPENVLMAPSLDGLKRRGLDNCMEVKSICAF